MSASSARDYRDRVNRRNRQNELALRAIQQLMSGKEWSSDTLDAIADVLTKHGYSVEEP